MVNSEDILVVIAYPNESTAQAAREWLSVLSAEDHITLELTASVTKDSAGNIDVQRPHEHRPLRHMLGRRRETPGIDDEVLLESAQSLEPGAVALYLAVRSVTPEEVIPPLSRYGGTVLSTSLPADREALLKEAFAQHYTAEQIAAEMNPSSKAHYD